MVLLWICCGFWSLFYLCFIFFVLLPFGLRFCAVSALCFSPVLIRRLIITVQPNLLKQILYSLIQQNRLFLVVAIQACSYSSSSRQLKIMQLVLPSLATRLLYYSINFILSLIFFRAINNRIFEFFFFFLFPASFYSA